MRKLFVLATLVFLAFLVGGCDEGAVSKKHLVREIDSLVENLKPLRTGLERLTGEETPDVVWQRGEEEGSGADAASEADLRKELNRLRREMVDLAIAVSRLTNRQQDQQTPPASSRSRQLTRSNEVYEIRTDRIVRNREVILANVGKDPVVNPRLVVNGERRWFSTEDILSEVIDGSMSERQRALAIWSFLVKNRHHALPAHDDIETHDPVRYLNIYGYGFCDDSATNFMMLAEQAGLKSRVWGLSGHVVPEVHFDGAWHMLDPDGEVYYLDDDGTTISSVQTLEQRPDIIRKYASPVYNDAERLIEIYTTTEDNAVSKWYDKVSEAEHRMDFVLRPGESIMRSWDNWGLYFSSRYFNEPKAYGNGRFRYDPPFEAGLSKTWASSWSGLSIVQHQGRYVLTVPSTEETGTMTLPFASPYPLLAGRIRVTGYAAGGGEVMVEFSEDGRSWLTVGKSEGHGSIALDLPTRSFFRNGYGRPIYTYLLRFRLRRPATVERIVVESDFQHAPQALPELKSGLNRLEYWDETEGERSIEITYRFDEDDKQLTAIGTRP